MYIRPCPWVGCRHHLLIELRRNGIPILRGKRRALPSSAAQQLVDRWIAEAVAMLDEMPATCVLDLVEDKRTHGPEATARTLSLTAQRVDQVTGPANRELKARLAAAGVTP